MYLLVDIKMDLHFGRTHLDISINRFERCQMYDIIKPSGDIDISLAGRRVERELEEGN
jgi:hypothetical protein